MRIYIDNYKSYYDVLKHIELKCFTIFMPFHYRPKAE